MIDVMKPNFLKCILAYSLSLTFGVLCQINLRGKW